MRFHTTGSINKLYIFGAMSTEMPVILFMLVLPRNPSFLPIKYELFAYVHNVVLTVSTSYMCGKQLIHVSNILYEHVCVYAYTICVRSGD